MALYICVCALMHTHCLHIHMPMHMSVQMSAHYMHVCTQALLTMPEHAGGNGMAEVRQGYR